MSYDDLYLNHHEIFYIKWCNNVILRRNGFIRNIYGEVSDCNTRLQFFYNSSFGCKLIEINNDLFKMSSQILSLLVPKINVVENYRYLQTAMFLL